ncbi:MAG: Trk system potassium transporter TrkA [Pseudomonadota bacterium]
MKIIILGAGQVGTTAASNLSREESNEVTVVDLDIERLRELQDRLDIRTVQGYASHPSVLRSAGAEDADMIIALTDSDETNMVACQIAYTLFHTPTKIARVRAASYMRAERLFAQEALPVDVIISPEQLVTEYIERLIRYPGALQVLEFADGKVRLVGARVHKDSPLAGQQLKALREHVPDVDARIAAIYRRVSGTAGDVEAIKPEGDTIIRPDDEVFFLAARKDIRVVMSELRKLEDPVRRVIIAGGGNIGFRLAKTLERTNQVKLIERDRGRAREISERLGKTIVLTGDAADRDLLLEENIENTDVFCAVTNAEEANILSAMLAKRLGARKTMALINRPSYATLVESGPVDVRIDLAISPQQITIGSLLAHVRRGDVTRVHSLRGGTAEAIETIAHGNPDSSKVVGRTIDEIKLPSGAIIAALVRGDSVIMAHHDSVIEPDDHVMIFVTNRKQIGEVEKLFQVGVTFV